MHSKLSSNALKIAVGATSLTLSAGLLWYLLKRNRNNDSKVEKKGGEEHKPAMKKEEPVCELTIPKDTKHLTEKEAIFRSSVVKNNVSYQLYILAPKGDSYSGIVGVEFSLDEAGKIAMNEDLFLDFTGETINEIKVNSNEITKNAEGTFKVWNGDRIYIDRNLLRVGKNSIWIRFENKYTRDGEGFHSFVDVDGKQYLYTNFEPFFCHKWFPCFDQPDIKGSLQLNSLVPKEWTVIGNEFASSKNEYNPTTIRGLLGESGLSIKEYLMKADSNFEFYQFDKTKNISTYLFAMIAGPYREIKCNLKSLPVKCNVPLSIYCREANLEYLKKDADRIFEVTAVSINFFSDFFGYPFPFTKYDQIWCPEFNVGAMENVGAITFNDTAYTFKEEVPLEKFSQRHSTIVHELCHMWFGDLVTMKWWNDLWLNESFAECLCLYALTQLKLNHPISDFHVMTNSKKNWGYVEDQLSTTHPIAGDVADTQQAENIFDGITYSKGQSVIRQLLWLLTPERFSKALSNYFNKYQWKNTVLSDFINEIKNVYQGGTFTIDEWVNEWICTAGLNECEADWDPSRTSDNEVLTIKQRPVLAEHPTLRHHKMKVAFFDDEGRVHEEDIMLNNKAETTIKYNGSKQYKAVLPNHQDQAFIKLILDTHSINWFQQNLGKVVEPINRILIWKSFYDMVRDGKSSSAEFLSLAIKSIPEEKESILSKFILDYSSNSVSTWTPRVHREELCKKLFDSVIQLLKKDSELSIHHLLDLKSRLVSFAKHKDHLRKVFNWLLGKDEELKRFEVNLTEGWGIVEKVCNSADFTKEEKDEVIKLQSSRDSSDIKVRKLKKVEALLNDSSDFRQGLWKYYLDAKTEDSMYMVNASMSGFNRAEKVDEEYINTYFAELKGVFENRPVRFAENFFDILFPESDNIADLLKRVEGQLVCVEGEAYSVFIRKLKEQCDFLRRKQRTYDCFLKFAKL